MEKLNIATSGRWLSLVCASLGMLFSTPRSVSAQSALTWARVELTRNQVQLFTNGQSRRARVSDVLGIGDALRTARSARAELRFNDGSLARIGESAVFQFTPNTRNFRLSNGTVLLLIPPGQGRTTIQTPNAVTGIHGSALFVRFIPETKTTIIGALTNNPAGPMMAFNQDGSAQQPLYAGEMAVLQEDGTLELFSFDLDEFYATSDLVADLQLDDPDASTGDAAIDAVRQEIQDALNKTSFEDSNDVIQNPAFLSANAASPVRSTAIPDFDLSPAAAFLQQTTIRTGFESEVSATVNQSVPNQIQPNPPQNVSQPVAPPPAPPTASETPGNGPTGSVQTPLPTSPTAPNVTEPAMPEPSGPVEKPGPTVTPIVVEPQVPETGPANAPVVNTPEPIVPPTVNPPAASPNLVPMEPNIPSVDPAKPVVTIESIPVAPVEPVLIEPTEPIFVAPTEPIFVAPVEQVVIPAAPTVPMEVPIENVIPAGENGFENLTDLNLIETVLEPEAEIQAERLPENILSQEAPAPPELSPPEAVPPEMPTEIPAENMPMEAPPTEAPVGNMP